MAPREPAEPLGRIISETGATQEGDGVGVRESPKRELREERRRGRRQRPGGQRRVPPGQYEFAAGRQRADELLAQPAIDQAEALVGVQRDHDRPFTAGKGR